MLLIIEDKHCKDNEFRYKTIEKVDKIAHDDFMIEIIYKNGTRQSWSTSEIKIVDIAIGNLE